MLATLRQRNFALLWCAGLISLIGARAMMTALPFYVYQQTGATLATAALFTAAYLPMVLLGSVAGVFVDRWDRKRIMVLTNLIQAFGMLLLLLVRSGAWFWLVCLVAFVETSVAMFFSPAERALLPRLVREDQLIPANALAGLNDNIARLAGPPIGGALLGLLGLGSVALVDSASFLLAAVLIALISVSSRPAREQVDVADAVVSSWLRVWREWLDGLKVVRKDRLIAALFVVFGVTSLGGTIIDPLYAPFVRSVLHGGAAALGWLSTIGALGGLLGGLIVGQFGRKVPPRHLTGVGTVVVGMLMLVIYNQTSLPVVMVLGFVLTVPVVGAGVGSSTLLQTGVPDAYRGRVFGAASSPHSVRPGDCSSIERRPCNRGPGTCRVGHESPESRRRDRQCGSPWSYRHGSHRRIAGPGSQEGLPCLRERCWCAPG
jgi:MFS family permease